MDWERRCLRLCAAVLLCALGLRLVYGDAFTPLVQALDNPEAVSFLIYLQTGRIVRLEHQEPEPTASIPVETPTVPLPSEPSREKPVFSPDEAGKLGITYRCALRPDLGELLSKPLEWDLFSEEPTVLILHTHTTESYTKAETEDYTESSPYRTLDPDHNLLAIGDLVAGALENAGIGVIHDRQYHDYPSYNGAYDHAAASTKQILENYPSIRLVLDLHRDAADMDYGQMVTQCFADGKSSAQLMLVVGSDAGPLDHPEWEKNLGLALKLHTLLEQDTPGICRDLLLTSQRYNQHLGSYALLVEVGAAGNTMEEAKLAAEKLAGAIIRLAEGSE